MKKNYGFTLIEMVIAISLVVLIITAVLSSFGPWFKFNQRLETEQKLEDLAQATAALYRAHAFNIDNNSSVITGLAALGAANGVLVLNPTMPPLQSDCQTAAGVDPTDTTDAILNLAPLKPYLSKSLEEVVTDGFNSTICVLISPRQFRDYGGVRLFFHTIAYVSRGENIRLDPGTELVNTGSGFNLVLDGDDTGMIVDGFAIALEKHDITLRRLKNLAESYETYFTIRFFTNADRDISINYFYVNDGSNNGDPGDMNTVRDPGPTIPSTRTTLGGSWELSSFDNVRDPIQDVSIGIALGVSERDMIDGWGNPIIVDNRSGRVNAGVTEFGIRKQPPFTSFFGALLPGTDSECNTLPPSNINAQCSTFLTATAVGRYSN